MATGNDSADFTDIRKGNDALLHVMNQHFLVEILKVQDDVIHVSFPGQDYPIEGMRVDLEFHDKSGFNSYKTIVLQGPYETAGDLILTKPHATMRAQHRGSCRVPTDLSVQVKDQAHVRRYDASVINLSSGGALIETDGPFTLDMTLEFTLSLPGEPTHVLLGQVVHFTNRQAQDEASRQLLGLKFVGLDPDASECITKYLWERLKTLYPQLHR